MSGVDDNRPKFYEDDLEVGGLDDLTTEPKAAAAPQAHAEPQKTGLDKIAELMAKQKGGAAAPSVEAKPLAPQPVPAKPAAVKQARPAEAPALTPVAAVPVAAPKAPTAPVAKPQAAPLAPQAQAVPAAPKVVAAPVAPKPVVAPQAAPRIEPVVEPRGEAQPRVTEKPRVVETPQPRPQAAQPAPAQRPRSQEEAKVSETMLPGRGLDVGTANLVGSQMSESGEIRIKPMRNAFLDVPEEPFTRNMLVKQNIPFIKRENKLYVVGEKAFELANIFNREMRRPMKDGMISPADADAMPMEVELVRSILGEPIIPNEMVYFSVPADPIDSTTNIVYHQNIFAGLLGKLGYRGKPFNEGLAVVYSELSDEEFTGIGISCGGGMVNVCVSYTGMPVIAFSTTKSGDWIDRQAAQVMGTAASRITATKERGIAIDKPQTPEEEAICIYYRNMINYSLTKIMEKFSTLKDVPNFAKPVSIVVSGGTSRVGGFIEVFKSEFDKLKRTFPIKVADIRLAPDLMNSTAKGCLIAALSDEDGSK